MRLVWGLEPQPGLMRANVCTLPGELPPGTAARLPTSSLPLHHRNYHLVPDSKQNTLVCNLEPQHTHTVFLGGKELSRVSPGENAIVISELCTRSSGDMGDKENAGPENLRASSVHTMADHSVHRKVT